MSITDGLAAAAPVNTDPVQAGRTVDAGEGPAAKRAKHTGMADSEATNAPVTLPTPTPAPAEDKVTQTESLCFAPAAAEPSDAHGGFLWTSSHMPNTFSQLSDDLILCMLA